MNLILTVDHHFVRTPDGNVYVPGIHDSLFWEKYLLEFDKVYALVRMRNDSFENVKGLLLSSHEKVEFIPIPFFRGPKELATKYLSVRTAIKETIRKIDADCAIIRAPSTIGFIAFEYCKAKGIPTALEVVASPHEIVKSGPLIHKIFNYIYTLQLKRACRLADGAAYVTKDAIQRYYPPMGFTTNYSSIDLPSEYFYKRSGYSSNNPIRKLIHVSTLQVEGKGHDVLLQALKIIRDKGYDLECVIVGGGARLGFYQKYAEKLGLSKYVNFTGNIASKEDLRQELINADIFVLPTISEGLPRVVIEAMACSLPCISTSVGGIPELLESEYLLNPNDYEAFACRIINLIDNPDEWERQSKRNYEVAKDYSRETLNGRRRVFFRQLIAKKIKK